MYYDFHKYFIAIIQYIYSIYIQYISRLQYPYTFNKNVCTQLSICSTVICTAFATQLGK